MAAQPSLTDDHREHAPRRCIGFGEHRDTCTRRAGPLNEALLWCDRCERARRAAITKSMTRIRRSFATGERSL